ncbi:velvet factor-domain-containing protein, partial [Zychaea mexicana]|uniref:velvet factor-domain-containing protein n=1 Tax=Zychaea mexicana TaxID=64656 RepID=UPI0022FDFA7C
MSTVVPPPLGLGRPSRKSIQYRLVVIQHPTRARCCGFGEKDKRPINPPPILQLHVTNSDGLLTPTDNVSHLIVQCDLFSADRKDNRNVVYNPASINPAYPNSNAAGAFCLRFRFIDLTAGEPLTMSTQVLHEVFSDPFSVYSAKNFPGMTGTTPLSLCFSKQGIKISVRKSPGSKR